MGKKKVLVWETLSTVAGGQKMTLTVLDMLSDQYEFCCLIPAEGMLSEELKKRNIPYVLMGDQTLPAGVKGKQVIFRYGWMSVKNVWKSLGIIRKYKPDILYAPGPAALPWSAFCGKLSHKPVIWHLHHIFLDGATRKLLNICGNWKSVREIIAVSNCAGDQIVNERAHEKVKVLYNPVDVEIYAEGDPKNVMREISQRIPEVSGADRVVLGHIALIQRSKRQDFVIELIAHLSRLGKDAIGVFAGETREEDYMQDLQAKAGKLGVEERIVFLGWRSDIPDVLKAIDVLVIPSAFEGFPLAGLEAASAGVPVAACDAAGAKEFAAVSGDGAIFKENDIESAFEAVNQCIAGRTRFAERGKRFAEMSSTSAYKNKMELSFAKVGAEKG